MSESSQSPLTVIGLGAMGTALASTFLRNGHPTTVWNRTPAKADTLGARGAAVAATAAEAAAASPLVVVCLLNDDTVHQVLDPLAGTLAGRAVVNLTNGTPRQARETARWAAGHGAAYLDGGIMATPPMIGRPEALVFYSGSRDAFGAYEPTLTELGAARYLGADAGLAALYDLALLSAMYGMFGGFYHAVALAGSEKIPAAEFTPLVVNWLNAMMTSLPRAAAAIDAGDQPSEDSNLEMQATGYVNLLDASRDQGISTELVEPTQGLLNRAVAAGRRRGNEASLVELLRTDADRPAIRSEQ